MDQNSMHELNPLSKFLEMETDSINTQVKELDEKSLIVLDSILSFLTKAGSEDFQYVKEMLKLDAYLADLLNTFHGTKEPSSMIFYLLSVILSHVGSSKFLSKRPLYRESFHSLCSVQHNNVLHTDFMVLPTDVATVISSAEVNHSELRHFWTTKFLLEGLMRIAARHSASDDKNDVITLVREELARQIVDSLALVATGHLLASSSKANDSGSQCCLTPFAMSWDIYGDCLTNLTVQWLSEQPPDNSTATGDYSGPSNVAGRAAMQSLLLHLHYTVRKESVDSDMHQLCLSTLLQLLSIKVPAATIKYPVANLLSKLPNWLLDFITDAKGKEFESLTYLGPFLCGSIFPEDYSKFAVEIMKTEDEQSAKSQNFQIRLSTVWDIQFQIVKLLLQEKSSHEATIKYLTRALCVNRSRGSLQPDETTASGEGLLTNLCTILQRLAVPIKLDRVDLNHLTAVAALPDQEQDERWELGRLLADETRLSMDSAALRQRGQTLLTESMILKVPDFHTRCFLLTTVAHNYGLLGSLRKQARRSAAIQSIQRVVDQIAAASSSPQSRLPQQQSGQQAQQSQQQSQQQQTIPVQPQSQRLSPQQQQQLQRYKAMLLHQKKAAACTDLVLGHSFFLRGGLEYCVQLFQVLCRCYDDRQQMTVDVDVEQPCPGVLAAVPQFWLEDAADLLIHLQKTQPAMMGFLSPQLASSAFLGAVLLICCHPHFVRSPYLVAKFVELLFGLQPSVTSEPGLLQLGRAALAHPLVTGGRLTHSLLRFYIDVEKTGAASEFYDKFSIRFKISVILRSMWREPGGLLKIQLLEEAARRRDHFVKFINRALNDMVYLLDESICALRRIRTVLDEAHPSESQRTQLAHDERVTRSQLTLADVTVLMLADFTREIPRPFLVAELADKLATMLDSLLLELVGPHCLHLKLTNPERYNWAPKKLLAQLVRIYLNLDSPELVSAVASDQRYYSDDLFRNAHVKITKFAVVGQHEAEHFDLLRQKVLVEVQQRATEDQELEGDEAVPGEYLDPIMNSVMREPVMLPQSRAIIDMAVIKRHLLNDDCDPFNRQPLKVEDLIPQPELQQEIQNWRTQRLQKNKPE